MAVDAATESAAVAVAGEPAAAAAEPVTEPAAAAAEPAVEPAAAPEAAAAPAAPEDPAAAAPEEPFVFDKAAVQRLSAVLRNVRRAGAGGAAPAPAAGLAVLHAVPSCADWPAPRAPPPLAPPLCAVRGHPQLPQLYRAQGAHRRGREAVHPQLQVRGGGQAAGWLAPLVGWSGELGGWLVLGRLVRLSGFRKPIALCLRCGRLPRRRVLTVSASPSPPALAPRQVRGRD